MLRDLRVGFFVKEENIIRKPYGEISLLFIYRLYTWVWERRNCES
jgi:hypothetical protein